MSFRHNRQAVAAVVNDTSHWMKQLLCAAIFVDLLIIVFC